MLEALVFVFMVLAVHRIARSDVLETPALNPTARRWATYALILTLLTSSMILVTGLLHWFGANALLEEIAGWIGIVCMQLLLACGVRYAAINRPVENEY